MNNCKSNHFIKFLKNRLMSHLTNHLRPKKFKKPKKIPYVKKVRIVSFSRDTRFILESGSKKIQKNNFTQKRRCSKKYTK